MEFVSNSELKFAPLISSRAHGTYQMTLVVKGVFDLTNNAPASSADKQFFPCGDIPFESGSTAENRYESDFVPFKQRADLLLAGRCHAPDGIPIQQCHVTFEVGSVRKRIEVFGNRYWDHKLGVVPVMSSTEVFTDVELRYANSFGGVEFKRNPVGKGYGAAPPESNERRYPLPNLEHPAQRIISPDSRPDPVGFGPLGMYWQDRFRKVGTYDEKWLKGRWPCHPADFDWGFFNSAPPDMQVEGYLRGDETLFFENLHPVHSQYRSQLPRLRVRCFVNTIDNAGHNDAEFKQVAMSIDTLFVDMDTEKLTLVWRGLTEITSDDYQEVKHVFVWTEDLEAAERSLAEYRRLFEKEQSASQKVEGIALEVPDVDEWTAKSEREVSEIIATSVDAKAINRELAAAFGVGVVMFPDDLAGQGLHDQLAAIDAFGASILSISEARAAEGERDMRARLAAAGTDPDEYFAKLRADSQAATAQILKQYGIDEELRKVDTELIDVAADLHRYGIDFAAAGVTLPPIAGGLRGLGVDLAALGIDLGPAPPPLDRQTIPAQVAAGEGLSGALLAGIDLSQLDLRNADFRNAILPDANFEKADLTGADFTGAVLARVNFSGSKLIRATFKDANMSKAVLADADLTGAVLEDAILEEANAAKAIFDKVTARGANFTAANLTGARFTESACPGVDFSKSELEEANFQQADLTDAALDEVTGKNVNFTAADLTRVRAKGCQLAAAIFHQARLVESNWSDAELTHADFSHAQVDGAFLIASELADANFTAASLRGARFSKAKLQRAKLVDANLFQTVFDKADLTAADLSRANAFNADFFEAVLDEATLQGTILRMTLLSSS